MRSICNEALTLLGEAPITALTAWVRRDQVRYNEAEQFLGVSLAQQLNNTSEVVAAGDGHPIARSDPVAVAESGRDGGHEALVLAERDPALRRTVGEHEVLGVAVPHRGSERVPERGDAVGHGEHRLAEDLDLLVSVGGSISPGVVNAPFAQTTICPLGPSAVSAGSAGTPDPDSMRSGSA